ncbi:MAG: hypothetical protein ACE5EX_10330 [Phycisphaerae bacterium]
MRVESCLIKPGEGCPGAGDFGNAEHDGWFREYRLIRAFPAAAANLDSRPARLVEALTVIESERKLVEQSDACDRMGRDG